jgi:predicted transposase YdaD
MTSRPHDALFKTAFEAPPDAASLLRELVPPPIRAVIAWDTMERERGSFVDAVLADRHSDLLFSARLRVGKPDLVYLLLEHQSSDDPSMPFRMLAYQTRIWDRFRKEQPDARLPPIIGVLVSHVPGGWPATRALQDMFDPEVIAISELAELLPRCPMIVEDLAHRSNRDLAARSLAPFQKLALWLLRDARDPVRLLGNFDAWRSTLIEAGQTRSGFDALAVLIHYMFRVVDPMYFDALRAKLRELGTRSEEIAMNIAEYLEERGRTQGREEGRTEGREEGRTEGREEGRTQGRVEGRVATLRSLLVFKFQALDAGAEARLQAATPEAIDRYLQRVLTADSLAAVFED